MYTYVCACLYIFISPTHPPKTNTNSTSRILFEFTNRLSKIILGTYNCSATLYFSIAHHRNDRCDIWCELQKFRRIYTKLNYFHQTHIHTQIQYIHINGINSRFGFGKLQNIVTVTHHTKY